MNLIQYFVQTKDKCILTDSLFYGTIKYSESSGELKCENAFFVLLVTSGKAKIHIENAHDYTHGVGKNDLLIIPASMTARFRQLPRSYSSFFPQSAIESISIRKTVRIRYEAFFCIHTLKECCRQLF